MCADFKVKKPYFSDDGRLKLYCKAPGHRFQPAIDLEIRRMGPFSSQERKELSDQFANGRSDCIVECAFKPFPEPTWSIYKVRTDRQGANFVTTVISTMEVMIDDVTIDELVRHSTKRLANVLPRSDPRRPHPMVKWCTVFAHQRWVGRVEEEERVGMTRLSDGIHGIRGVGAVAGVGGVRGVGWFCNVGGGVGSTVLVL